MQDELQRATALCQHLEATEGSQQQHLSQLEGMCQVVTQERNMQSSQGGKINTEVRAIQQSLEDANKVQTHESAAIEEYKARELVQDDRMTAMRYELQDTKGELVAEDQKTPDRQSRHTRE